jgi:carboxylesterase
LNSYVEARPRLNAGTGRHTHAVLLLHGYSASPHELNSLSSALDRTGVPYYAPLLTGHGLQSLHLLARVQPADWLRDAVTAYDLLASLADDISVVGHSTGATLAAYLAQHRPVRHLVLSGPNLWPAPADRRARTLLAHPLTGWLLEWLLPVVAKPVRPGRVTWTDTCDPTAARAGFSYAALPTHSLRAQWALQDLVDLTRASYRTLTLVHGAHDLTVDIAAVTGLLDQRGLAYRYLSFPRSGHNVLQDYDRVQAAEAIVEVLTR